MKTINVITVTPLSEDVRRAMQAVSPAVKVQDITDLTRREYKGDEQAKKEVDAVLAEAEVLYGGRFPVNLLARAPSLKWIQIPFAGVDRFLTDEFKRSGVTLTNASGIHATPISEFVLEMMLMFAKQAPLLFEAKQRKEWRRVQLAVLRDKTAGVIGLGSIGQEVARLCKAFRMRVIATRRSPRSRKARNVDVLLPPSGLPRLLEESDYVAICLPLTPETRKLIGERELKMMKPTAYILNIGRGEIIDEAALVQALEEKWIAGAGLDVFATEPLPKESKLWELNNVIISPHVSGGMEDYEQHATEVFIRNLNRYVEGKKLVNVISKEKGY
ncbi:MAG: D-2-hydroxyacid dehydrogenase [Dehalococcoidia bacterium]|nr:D-2-hydroxyacid dehydrogenase [Dehalococcoidia bacterium]